MNKNIKQNGLTHNIYYDQPNHLNRPKRIVPLTAHRGPTIHHGRWHSRGK